MRDKTKGNIFVILQFVFLGLLILMPKQDLWPTEGLDYLTLAIWVLGIFVIAISFANLGRSLTANPVPLDRGTLKTSGLYKVVRHPIYLGLLLIAFSIATQGASVWHIVVFGGLSALLHYKASWEEKLLKQKYPEYASYAKKVGRLLPFIGRLK